jgi:hypothetical protein
MDFCVFTQRATMNHGKLVFSQLMAFLPSSTFRRCLATQNGDHKVHDFTCMDQLAAMAFAQQTYRDSLRGINLAIPGCHPSRLHLPPTAAHRP